MYTGLIRGMATVAVAAVMAVTAVPSRAANICVNPNNSNCESTIQDGIDAAATGDKINIASGTYYENVVIPSTKHDIVVSGGSGSILDPDDRPGTCSVTTATVCNTTSDCPGGETCQNNGTGSGILVQANNVTFQGFTIRNGDDDGIEIDDAVTGTIIKNMTITGSDDSCVDYAGGGGNDHTEITGLRCSGSYGVYLDGNDIIVQNNRFTNLDSTAIHIDGNTALVKNNLCDVTETCVEVTGNDAEITNNTAKNVDDGYLADVDGDNALIKQNQANLVYAGIYVDGQNPDVESNRIQGSGADDNPITFRCDTSCTTAVLSKNSVKGENYDYEGIYIRSTAPGATVEKNSVENIPDATGIYVASGSKNVTLSNNKVTTVGNRCFEINGTSVLSEAHTVENNQAKGCNDYGFYLTSSADGSALTSNSVNGAGNHAFNIQSSDGTLTKNSVSKADGVGFALRTGANDNDITSNKVSKNVRAAVCDAATGNTYSNNQFSAPSAGGYCPSL